MNLNKRGFMEENNEIRNGRRNLEKNNRKNIENTKKRNINLKTKNIIIVVAVIIVLVILAILIPKKANDSKKEKESKETISKFLEEIKKDEAMAIAKFGQTDLEKEINKAKYKYMTYTIEDIQKQGNKPTRYDITVKISNVDVNAAINETEEEMKSEQDKNEYAKKYMKIFNKKLSEKKKDKKEDIVKFTLVYDDMAKKYVVNNADTMKYLRR